MKNRLFWVLLASLVVLAASGVSAHQLNSSNSTVYPQLSANTLDIKKTAVMQNTTTAGAETHSGTETHTGTETHSGTVSLTGGGSVTGNLSATSGQTTLGNALGLVTAKSVTFSNESGFIMTNNHGTRFRVFLSASTITAAPR